MLRTVEIRDLLIIDRLDLEFQPGLNVMTGETGAGKSILLDALGFVLGWRGRADIVRQGAEQGEVTAAFELNPDHPALAVLQEAGIEHEPGEDLILRRIVRGDGRKTAWINDRRAGAETLRAVSDTLIELHGQHDDRGLMDPRGHAAMLDAFAELTDQATALRALHRKWRAALRQLEQENQRLEKLREEEEFLRHAVAELDKLAPEPGEADALDQVRRIMQQASKIGEDVDKAANILGHDGAEGALVNALRWLEDASAKSEGVLDEAVSAVSRALNEVAEAQSAVANAQDSLSFDPFELEQKEERLFAIRAAARKHNVQPDDLAQKADGLRERLEAIDGGQARMSDLKAELQSAERTYRDAAMRLLSARQKAGAELDQAMAAELAPLKLERASFVTNVGENMDHQDGSEVSFAVATNPGAPAGPLNKIASGGELSRFLLALKVCLARGANDLTIIFDEIDRGVGGATADAVGRRLAQLATDAQVLVVTHSPQVAARGAYHWQVSKSVTEEQTFSRVTPLDDAARIDEIARMLAGDTVTDQARSAAKALLGG